MSPIAPHKDLLSLEKRPLGSPQPEMLPFRWLTSDNDQSSDVECTGAEPSNQPLGTPHTVDLQTCYICQGTSDQESIMTCDGLGCSVITHLHCYFTAGSQDANDAITDIEHWHCENCGGLPRHMHPRPPATKRARVSFGPVLPAPLEVLTDQGDSATGHPSGGWGGHWPIRTEMSQPATGKGKEAMEPPINTTSLRDVQPPAPKRHAGPRPSSSGPHAPGGWGRAGDTAYTSHSTILRRDKELMDDDTTACFDPDLMIPPQPHPDAVARVVPMPMIRLYLCR